MVKRFAVILAAGQGTRMKSKLHKLLHPVVGRPMVQHVINQLKLVKFDELITVVGHGAEQVIDQIGIESEFVTQEKQLGTGHAVLKAEDLLGNEEGTTIVVCGDAPLITNETYKALIDYHEQEGAIATVLTAKTSEPAGYGRIIRNESNQVERIVEHKDANEAELLITETNTGTYCFDNKALFAALQNVSNDNAQGEYYLTDVIEILRSQSQKVSGFQTRDFDETIGINDRVTLAKVEKIMKQKINEKHMRNGVTIIDPDHTYIGLDVIISQDVTIQPGAMITGDSIIASHAVIGAGTEIDNCTIGESAVISHSVLKDSNIGKQAVIGPYANIRPESTIGDYAKVGHFVEVKKSTIGINSKIPHLSYIGDAEIGRNVNVGCGTITVNYDGKDKFVTEIGDHAFIGSNSNLIAPVKIGEGSYVAAGSTINKDVPSEALGIARAKQLNKLDYAKRIKKQKKD